MVVPGIAVAGTAAAKVLDAMATVALRAPLLVVAVRALATVRLHAVDAARLAVPTVKIKAAVASPPLVNCAPNVEVPQPVAVAVGAVEVVASWVVDFCMVV